VRSTLKSGKQEQNCLDGWTKVFDEKWHKWSLKSNKGFDKFYDHEPTLDDIKEAKTQPTPPSVSTPQQQSSNTQPSNVRTLLERGTFPTRPEAETFAKTLKGKTDIQHGDKAGWFAVYEEEGTPKLSSEEASQIHDYFTLNLEDAKIDPTKHEEEFKKALDTTKTWQENLEIMDTLIRQIQSYTQTQTQTQAQAQAQTQTQPQPRSPLPMVIFKADIKKPSTFNIYHPMESFRLVINPPSGYQIMLNPSDQFPRSIEIWDRASEIIDHREMATVPSPEIKGNCIEWIVKKPKIQYGYKVNYKTLKENDQPPH
jgi:hypothetical protein